MPDGRLSLRLDAAYCGVAALGLAVFAGPAARALDVPPAAIFAVAAAVGIWAYALSRAARRPALRPWLLFVLVANVAAATAIAVLATARPWQGAFTLLLLAVAVEVAAFAVSQALALRPAPAARES